jgi:hypothetical protein
MSLHRAKTQKNIIIIIIIIIFTTMKTSNLTLHLVHLQEALEKVFSSDFKTTSCPVVIDFLIRHGLISPETGNCSTTKEQDVD